MKKLALVTILILQSVSAWAVCVTQPAEISYLEYPFVFLGTVTGIVKEADITAAPPTSAVVTVNVDEALKGELPKTLEVDGKSFESGTFEAGAKYLFFVHEREGRYISEMCGPTVPLEDAASVPLLISPEYQLRGIARMKSALAAPEPAAIEGAFTSNFIGENGEQISSYKIVETGEGAFEYNGFDQNGALIETRTIKGTEETVINYTKTGKIQTNISKGLMTGCFVPD